MDLFVTCAQSLEPLLAQELGEMGYPQAVTGFRGVSVPRVNLEAVYRINYLSRIGGRVLMPIARFRCRNARSLYEDTRKINWKPFFASNKTMAIDANVHHPELRNSLFAAQVVKDAICDQLREASGHRPDVNLKTPDVQLNLFINNDVAILSVDTSGAPLHKRGYRQETVEAPMQESLAAALLSLANYKGTEILCDPCCGSGTILIEAALIASKTPPGFLRTRWGFQCLPEHSQEMWLKVKGEADTLRIPLEKDRFFGADISKGAVHASRVNLRAIGMHQQVQIAHYDIRDYQPPVLPTIVITNPPYGRRLDDVEHLRALYRAIGDFMKQKTAKPAKGFVFTGSLELSKEVGLAPTRRHVLDNGGIEARLLEFDLY